MNDLDAKMVGKGRHDLLGFVQAQQAMIDEDAGKLVANSFMDQRRRHRRINTARQAQYDFVAADLRPYIGNSLFNVIGHVPVAIRSEEHTSELQSLMRISYAAFCL